MIRLDGNSLAAFRGAGVAGTVQSVAGCELFGEHRWPSWASPYSAAATRALKAQFPTQWPTIRDYGFAHPEIVGYMNAYAPEDAKIAYSLVPTLGKWRKIVSSNGQGYFTTNQYLTSYPLIIKAKICNAVASGEKDFFGNYNGNGNFVAGGNGSNVYVWSSGAWTPTPLAAGVAHDVEYHLLGSTGRKIIVDGQEFTGTQSNTSVGNPGRPLGIFTGGGDRAYCPPAKDSWITFAEIECNGGTSKGYYIPFKRNGQMELLDLVSGNLATRVGTFTELIESPA